MLLNYKQLSIFELLKSPFKRKKVTKKKALSTPRSPKRYKDSPELKQIWTSLKDCYFPSNSQLEEYTVKWSTRPQKRTLASCNIEKKVVSVAREFQNPALTHLLSPLIFHEMCHAVVDKNPEKSRGKMLWHGKRFKALEAQHPGIPLLNEWIKDGGWLTAVRSDRTRRAHQKRKLAANQ